MRERKKETPFWWSSFFFVFFFFVFFFRAKKKKCSFFFPLTFETDLSEERGKKDTKKKLKIIGNISDAKKSPTKEEKIPLPAS